MRKATRSVPVWDPFIRLFHWSLAISYALAWATAESAMALHERAGYFILTLLALRVFWGIVGSRHARFHAFVRGPTAALSYLRRLAAGRPKDYLGHNPAGGWMVLLLLAGLLGTVMTGIVMPGGEDLWEELHEGFANSTLLLVAVHVSAVVVSSVLHGQNLIAAMISGRKNVEVEHE